ncbi:MAG: cytochrome c3 family protein [Trueperaceae bacterium]|nr:cytochrome c3 family protein [Trueperaceae bacterium]
MPNYFPPNANAFAKWLIWGGVVFMALLATSLTVFARTSNNKVRVPIEQPVAFSHALHNGQLGLDCRYCHTSVEVAAAANIPPTETCMTCHSQIRVGSPQLAAVQASWDSGEPLAWNKVHDLADFVYFNHSAHINKGIGCSSCHGRIDQMAAIWKNEPMTMGWCLECHRNPAAQVRPRSEVFNMAYVPPAEGQLELGEQLVEAYHINEEKLPQCSTCHR